MSPSKPRPDDHLVEPMYAALAERGDAPSATGRTGAVHPLLLLALAALAALAGALAFLG